MLGARVIAKGFLSIAALAILSTALAQDSGNQVREKYGSREGIQQFLFQPMTTDAPMQTVDGDDFDANFECKATGEFMRIAFVPSAQNDLQTVAVEMDRDMNGSREYLTSIPGPLAAVCANGAVRCQAGSTENCQGLKWIASAGTLTTELVATKELGGCYCFNNSCGAGLLGNNSRQVLGDLGAGIANAMQKEYPRIAVGSGKQVDASTMVFYGQDGACGGTERPEQHYGSPETAAAEGAAAGSDPNSLYYKMANSPAANDYAHKSANCTINRQVTSESYWNPLAMDARVTPNGGVTGCGDGCFLLLAGRSDAGNYLSMGGCGMHTETAIVTINRPSLLQSAILERVGFDDWLRIWIGNDIVYNVDPNWTYPGPRCGENGSRGTRHPGIDLTSYFSGLSPGEQVQVRVEVSVADKGEGFADIRFRFGADCRVASESVNNGCATLEQNMACTLRDENVDSVFTYRSYSSTGVSPLPSEREFFAPGCSYKLTRDWWVKKREYSCEGEGDEFDVSYAEDRYQVISSSYDADTGAFTDRRVAEDGTVSSHAMTTPLVPKAPTECQPMCKTRKPRPGPHLREDGTSSSELNVTGPAWDYTFYECEQSNICPAGAGEEVIKTCNCNDSFMEAVTVMQSIRMMTQDAQCVADP